MLEPSSEPRPAASLILLRESPLEVLMLRRNPNASFAPDFWVFPGGIAEEKDGGDFRVTAVRETLEETNIAIDDVNQLVWTSRWITPIGSPKRFDTYFFLAKAPNTDVTVDGSEIVDHIWIRPAAALEQLKMIFPTIKNLEALLGFDSADALMDSRRGAVIEPVQPVLVNGKPALL
ncbi:MAG TPA: NUDIX hydrolase [Thermoanaerobaculia bacterium]|nr:NUDIX hydrolase [Thermoanaerobaculia bacterium]